MPPFDENPVENDVNVDEQVFWNEEIFRNSLVPENVTFARTDQKLEYVSHSPSHVGSRSFELYHGRKTNFMLWFLLLFMAPQLASAIHAESETEAETDWFGVMLRTLFVLILSTDFMIGRYSHGAPPEVRANVQEAGVQKDEALVPARLREEVKRLKQEILRWSNKAEESRLAACEARVALNLAIQGQNDAVTLVQMDEHGNGRHGAKWQLPFVQPADHSTRSF